LLLSRPGSNAEGAYYLTSRTPEDRAMSTAEVFLGVRVQCAQCHHHPFERWSQDDFWQFAAFFARVPGQTLVPGSIRGRPVLTPNAQGPTPDAEVLNPRTKRPAF